MLSRPSLAACAAAIGLCASLGSSARAGDGAAPPPAASAPTSVPKIDNAFLLGLVGSWDFTLKGTVGEGVGVSRIRTAAGGTALVQESQVTVSAQRVYALNVIRVDEGGKVAKVWRFDTLSPVDVTALKGALTPEGFDAQSDAGSTMRARKTDGGFEVVFARGAQMGWTMTYRKAAKDVELDAPDAPKDGLRPAMIGSFDVVGEWTMPGPNGAPSTIPVAGVSTFRWALGGRGMVHDFDRTAPKGVGGALGVHRASADGSSTKVWWFDGDRVDPMPADGPMTDSEWHGKGKMPDGSVMGLEWSKKGDGFELRYDLGGTPVGHETYKRKS